MPRTTALLAFAAFFATGCRTRGFVRPGSSSMEFYQDLQACEQQAAASWSFCWGWAWDQQAAQQKNRRNVCMQARGWQLSRAAEAFRP